MTIKIVDKETRAILTTIRGNSPASEEQAAQLALHRWRDNYFLTRRSDDSALEMVKD